MRAFVTGGTGFIGGQLVRKLRERGDDVVALVRSPDKAGDLKRLGCELVEGDVSSSDAIRRGAEGADACFHGAAIYKVGIPKSQHEEMYEANVRGTERVLDAAIQAVAMSPLPDMMLIGRLKRKKLALKDEIARLEDMLTPDIIA